jgi:hypothetical protein
MRKVVTLSEAKGLMRITPVMRVRCLASLSMTPIMKHLSETLHCFDDAFLTGLLIDGTP